MDCGGEKPRANERHLRGNSPEESWDQGSELSWKAEDDAPERGEAEQSAPRREVDSGGYNWQASKSSLKER